MILWLSGPTGAGKSTFANALEQRGWAVVREVIDTELFAKFSMEPREHCARLQASIMRSRQSQWAEMRGTDNVVFDRTAEEDFHVFCRMHAAGGLLSQGDLSDLRAISTEVSANTPQPDLTLYLRPSDDVLKDRVAFGHPLAITQNLALQVSLYEEWIARRRGSILKIDNSHCMLGAMNVFLGNL